MKWTKARTKELGSLWRTGMSASEMAEIMGVTRNAIISKCRHMCLKIVSQAPSVKKTVQATNTRAPKGGVSSLDLKSHHCRWPISPEGERYRFCGAQRVGLYPYCHGHGRMAYRYLSAEFSPAPAATMSCEAVVAEVAEVAASHTQATPDRDPNQPLVDPLA
jgi:hypothetical protein